MIDKDTKREICADISTGWYVARKVLVRIVATVLVLSVIGAGCNFAYNYWKTNADRAIFKQSVTYNEGMLDDLAKYKYELESAEDDVEKSAIAQLVNSRFANFDESKIENESLKNFLRDCRNGKY